MLKEPFIDFTWLFHDTVSSLGIRLILSSFKCLRVLITIWTSTTEKFNCTALRRPKWEWRMCSDSSSTAFLLAALDPWKIILTWKAGTVSRMLRKYWSKLEKNSFYFIEYTLCLFTFVWRWEGPEGPQPWSPGYSTPPPYSSPRPVFFSLHFVSFPPPPSFLPLEPRTFSPNLKTMDLMTKDIKNKWATDKTTVKKSLFTSEAVLTFQKIFCRCALGK